MGAVTQAVEKANAVPAQLTPKQAIVQLLDTNKQAIGLSLPKGFSADRFNRLLLTAANTNPDLFKCDPMSFLAAGVQCAQLGLEPNDARGLAYLLPMNDKTRGKVVQLIIGYRGMIDLARRSGMVTSINAFPVYSGDEFTYELGLSPTLHHIPGDHDENPADLTHVYAVAKINGDPQFVVLTRRQVEKAKGSSRGASSNYSPWSTHYVEMALKTAIRRLCKMLPQTVEVANALESDDRPLVLGDIGVHVADHDDAIDVTTGEILIPEDESSETLPV
jgi:recombination protein RecT